MEKREGKGEGGEGRGERKTNEELGRDHFVRENLSVSVCLLLNRRYDAKQEDVRGFEIK